MGKINLGCITAKVYGKEFHLQSSQIVEILELPDKGERSYFENVRTTIFLENYIWEEEFVVCVLY